MKFNSEKKHTIIMYILEKIEQGDESVSKTVSQAFEINQNTVHNYINELVENGLIKRVKRGYYELNTKRYKYDLKRSNGDLNTDTLAFDLCLEQHISNFAVNVKSIWSYAFSEMINNVMDHSSAENVEIIIEQNYLKTSASIIDDGIGIFEKIRKYFGLATLEDAICELFKGKLTTDSQNHSGEGIFFSSKLMDDFYIVSSGKIFTNNKYDNSRISTMVAENTNGTSVIMSLSNFSHKKPQEIFDLYANIDGGFTKTKIPMKNIFETSPVSRSQAKRVCNRLEQFKEVIIDFENIEWMGQGFAHQIFAIFARQHPEIKLVPINMNEDVEKMYRHVLDDDNAMNRIIDSLK
jgi:anti-sigma regulatory factor (Ser/Thr protein kinase)/predicted transcriptional regulator